MLLLMPLLLAAQTAPALTADEIMSRVSENQQRAVEARAHWVYTQKTHAKLLRPGGKMAREERREYVVTPQADKLNKELKSFEGAYEKGGKLVAYDKPGYQYKGIDIDGDLINDLTEDLTNDKKAKDGIDPDLFPLTREKQEEYEFTLKGTSEIKGRKAYKIAFRPKDRNEFAWAGEALIDAEEFQPAMIYTKLSRKIPAAVRVLLGTNFDQLGFSINYQRVADGVWFPSSYGTEFHFNLAFFYRRTVTFSMANSEFRKADVASAISYETAKQ